MSVNHGAAGPGTSGDGVPRRGPGAAGPGASGDGVPRRGAAGSASAAGEGLRFPEEEAAPGPQRRDWRETLRAATDLALLGLLTCFGALAGVTAAAAVATASAALDQWCEYETWPSARVTLRRFARAVLPGVGVSVLVLAVSALLTVNIRALATGVVPGGPALIAVTLVLAAAAAGYAGLVVVAVGRSQAEGWRAAARAAAHTAQSRPGVLAALAGVMALGAVLTVMVLPVIVPILVGYVLFGLHAVARRLAA